jgi:hypothetical protein
VVVALCVATFWRRTARSTVSVKHYRLYWSTDGPPMARSPRLRGFNRIPVQAGS